MGIRAELRSTLGLVAESSARTFAGPALSRRLAAAVAAAPVRRLAIGCSRTDLEGWICTDVSILRNRNHFLDATEPWPVTSESLVSVYADNVIEHLTLSQNRSFLRHAFAALGPGGRIRLVTPDIGRIAAAFVGGTEQYGGLDERNRRHGYEVEHAPDSLRAAFLHGHAQGYLFDEAALVDELTDAGFVAVHRVPVGISDDPAMSRLEQRTEDDADREFQLVVEGTKPNR